MWKLFRLPKQVLTVASNVNKMSVVSEIEFKINVKMFEI